MSAPSVRILTADHAYKKWTHLIGVSTCFVRICSGRVLLNSLRCELSL